MAIKIEKLDKDGNSYSPKKEITLSPVQRVEIRETFEPVLADTGEQREEDTFDPRFVHDYLKGRRKFSVHERVHAAGGDSAEKRAQDRMQFFTFKKYKDRFRFTCHNYNWLVTVTSARIVKIPAEDIYDFYLDLVGVR